MDIERSKEYSRDLSDFVEWKWESETSNDIIGHKFFEEVLLFDCAFVIVKNKSRLKLLYSVLLVERLKGPL